MNEKESKKDPLEYMRLRDNGYWYTYFSPPKFMGVKNPVRLSTDLKNQRDAEKFQNRLILPLLEESSRDHFLETLQGLISTSASRAGERYSDLVNDLNKNNIDTIRKLVDAYIDYLGKCKLSPGSIARYRANLRGFCIIIDEHRNPETLTTEDMANYRDELLCKSSNWQQITNPGSASDKLISKVTVSNCIQCVRSMFRWAIEDGKLKRMDIPGSKVKIKTGNTTADQPIPTNDEADALCEMTLKIKDYPISQKYMPSIFRYSGMRKGEAAQLSVDDIITEHGIRCYDLNNSGDKVLKNDPSRRLVPIADKVSGLIDELVKLVKNGKLFPDCGDYTSPQDVFIPAHNFSKVWNRAAKDVMSGMHLHVWRDYAITQMANAGIQEIDWKRVVGHKDTSVHAGYTKNDLGRLKKAVDTIY